MNGRENSEPIPVDLVIEILSRLPSKSIARCHCVSKLWDSILTRPYFMELAMTRSLARPKLLFRCKKDGEVFFFSSPQPQNPDVKSSLVAAKKHMNYPVDVDVSYEFCSPVNGLVCLIDKRIVNGREERVPLIFDPITGRSLTLPTLQTWMPVFLGYDPIDKQFKLLSITNYGRKHQIMTLGTEYLSWRMIECSIPHYHVSNGICINGVLYYKAWAYRLFKVSYGIVCFNVRSEKFNFIEEPEILTVALVNYKGKLATLKSDNKFFQADGESSSFELCVLEDTEKHEWSKHTYVLPSTWNDIVSSTLAIVGVTKIGEVVLSRRRQKSSRFYLIYYNLERNTFTKVGIQGIQAFRGRSVCVFLDHVENMNLEQVFRNSQFVTL